MIDWVELSKAVPYAAIAIVFGLFMLKVLELIGKQRDAAAERQDTVDARRDTQFIEAIGKRDLEWRDFMTQQQLLRGEQWMAVVVELKQLTAIVTLSADLLRSHDSWERGLLSALHQRRTGDGPQSQGDESGPNT